MSQWWDNIRLYVGYLWPYATVSYVDEQCGDVAGGYVELDDIVTELQEDMDKVHARFQKIEAQLAELSIRLESAEAALA